MGRIKEFDFIRHTSRQKRPTNRWKAIDEGNHLSLLERCMSDAQAARGGSWLCTNQTVSNPPNNEPNDHHHDRDEQQPNAQHDLGERRETQ